jgi:hypothetical protein
MRLLDVREPVAAAQILLDQRRLALDILLHGRAHRRKRRTEILTEGKRSA